MSSNNSNVHPDYDPNIKIKAEPGTVSETPSPTAPIVHNLITNIKTEPGLSTRSNRLLSLRQPRDYTLGGTVPIVKQEKRLNKVYTPNLNVQRTKNRDDQNTNNKNESAKKGRGRKNDHNKERNKGRAKAANNLVQSTGIFSEGLADISTKRHSGSSSYRDRDGSGGGRETAATLERPKLSIPLKVNKAEEAEKIRELLRDDFVDDGLETDLENTPVVLPLIDEGKIFKTESNKKVSLPTEEIGQSSDVFQNGEVKNKIKSSISQTRVTEAKMPLTVPQVMEINKLTNFILIQLPDCLPGLQSDEKQNDPRSKKGVEISKENEADKTSQFCTLNSLKEGMLGKLQILRSGKARLRLGDNDLIVDVGSNLSFRQDLIAAKITGDKQNGDLINLGPINNTLICSPDWEQMLKKL